LQNWAFFKWVTTRREPAIAVRFDTSAAKVDRS